MPDLSTVLYFLAVVGGTLVLGFGIAYGLTRNRERTAAEKRATEAGAHRIYEKEDQES